METLQLIQMLYNKEAGLRRQAVLIVGMVEETSALGALEQRAREETDSNILPIVQWAGKRVTQAKHRHFSTIDAIFDHFGINRELTSGLDPEEIELLRHQLNNVPSTQSGGILNDIRLGSMLTADNIKTGNLGQREVDKKSLLRIPPMPPSTMDISIRVKRLLNSENIKRQKNSAIELRDINNPDALPYLALTYYRNENPDIQSIIEQAGKVLYWSANYYAMERNGRLKLEIEKRQRDGIYPEQPKPKAPPPPRPEGNLGSVTDILNQAQRRRKRRK